MRTLQQHEVTVATLALEAHFDLIIAVQIDVFVTT